MAEKTKMRQDIPAQETWNLTDLFSTEESWEKEAADIPLEIEKLTVYRGEVTADAAALLACLEQWDELKEKIMNIVTYASLKDSADGTDPANQNLSARAASLYALVQRETAFIESEILTLTEEQLEGYIEEQPVLAEFRKPLRDIIRSRPHRLDPAAEEVLAAFSEVLQSPYMIYQRSKTSDMSFPSFQTEDGREFPLTFNSFATYEAEADTEIRRKAYETFTSVLNQYKHTYAATQATEMKKQVTEAGMRGFASVTDMLLDKQDVTQDMYHRQLDTIQEELAPHMRRFAKLKQRVLGLEEMRFADLKAPLDPGFDPEITYEEAGDLVLEALKVMGPEYMEIMEKGVKNRWVDRADNIGKRSGAFCSSPYGAHPYIMMTWSNSMRNAFTLAHELGHAGHFSLAGSYQRISSTRPSLYFIEAPSTMNEILLSQHIVRKSEDERMRRWVILQSLGTYYHNFVTHILEGELQRRVYAMADSGVPITAEVLCGEKVEVLKNFWGDAVHIDEGAGLTWMRQPHYYMGLYSYTYSAGLTASTAAAETIQREGQPAVDRWLEVLKAGGTKTPLELMKMGGVDMTTEEPIKQAVAYVGSLVDSLEAGFEK
ncbi:oligoendopeptidase F [Alkalicoccus halolimnae]|uniref:Oligopeptidase F n=1 Tax=Alkalicoccus halolimnae TaxID=1667239 RepID=A0A5C7F2A9_9BACI|nr:oligoendopeptidase F [Alkalicoccus halolimnae]TXF82730.1 oligoendopeptidase F [Alkalicoccus halolimnae]